MKNIANFINLVALFSALVLSLIITGKRLLSYFGGEQLQYWPRNFLTDGNLWEFLHTGIFVFFGVFVCAGAAQIVCMLKRNSVIQTLSILGISLLLLSASTISPIPSNVDGVASRLRTLDSQVLLRFELAVSEMPDLVVSDFSGDIKKEFPELAKLGSSRPQFSVQNTHVTLYWNGLGSRAGVRGAYIERGGARFRQDQTKGSVIQIHPRIYAFERFY